MRPRPPPLLARARASRAGPAPLRPRHATRAAAPPPRAPTRRRIPARRAGHTPLRGSHAAPRDPDVALGAPCPRSGPPTGAPPQVLRDQICHPVQATAGTLGRSDASSPYDGTSRRTSLTARDLARRRLPTCLRRRPPTSSERRTWSTAPHRLGSILPRSNMGRPEPRPAVRARGAGGGPRPSRATAAVASLGRRALATPLVGALADRRALPAGQGQWRSIGSRHPKTRRGLR